VNFTFITVVLSVSSVPPRYCGILPKKRERVVILLTLCHKIKVTVITEDPQALEALARNYAGEDVIPPLRNMKITANVVR
jgi:hypothetical protein